MRRPSSFLGLFALLLGCYQSHPAGENPSGDGGSSRAVTDAGSADGGADGGADASAQRRCEPDPNWRAVSVVPYQPFAESLTFTIGPFEGSCSVAIDDGAQARCTLHSAMAAPDEAPCPSTDQVSYSISGYAWVAIPTSDGGHYDAIVDVAFSACADLICLDPASGR